MNRTTSGLVILAIGVGSWACKGDPQGDLRGDAVAVIASPSSLFINQGETELVLLEVNDAQDNQLAISDFTLTSNDPGVTVVEDSTFNLVFDANGDAVRPSPWTRARFEVTGTAFVSTTLTASGGGVTREVPVRVVPAMDLAVSISNLTPPLGDTLTFTAAAGTHFTDSSVVRFAGDSTPACNCIPIVVSVDPTGATMLVLVGPNVNGPATISNVQVNFDPSLVFTVNSVDAVVNAAAPADLGDPFSTTSPALGDTVTMTAPAGYIFQDSATVTFPDAAAPVLTARSADSTQQFILVSPNTDTTAVVANIAHERLGDFPFTLFTTAAMTSPVISNFPVTFAPSPALVGDTVVVTAGAGFLFSDAATATYPGGNVDVVGFAADSTTMSVVLQPDVADVTGPLTVDGVIASAAPQFELAIPTASDVTQTMENFAGTGDETTAPVIVIPSSGNSLTITDGGPFGGGTFAAGDSRFYTFTLTAQTTFDFTSAWSSDADLGFYFLDNPITQIFDQADSFGGGASGQPETGTFTLDAGTYLLAVVLFDPDPAAYTMVITTQ
jgi:hypothetical protein